MQALRKTHAGHGIELADAAEPVPGPNEVLVRVHSAGVCGTDLHIAEWTPSYHFLASALPVTIGHEFSGEIVACGEGADALPLGQLVAVRPSVTCGKCAACVSSDFDACTTRRGIGVMRNGGFAALVNVPLRNCVPVPAGVSAEVAALSEPLSVSWEAVRTGGVGPGDRVLVLGPGNIGQGIAVFARAAGARQVVVAGHGDAARLAVVQSLGFPDTLDLQGTDLESAAAPYLVHGKFDVVIEATGAAAVMAPALRVLKTHGVLVVTGIHAAPVPIDLVHLVRQHQQIRGSYRAAEAAWPQVVAFMRDHQDLLGRMVTHRVPLSRAPEAFALARDREASKVLIQPRLAAAGTQA